MANQLQSWFRQLPYGLRRELAGDLKTIADGLAADIKAAAPVRTGALKASVRVRRGRDSLELFVEAGGAETVKEVRTGSGVQSALHVEFGTQKMPAHPFFYSTYRARQDDVRQRIEDAVTKAIAKA